MRLQEIEKQARMLMTAHGVGRLEFAFDGGKKRLGQTKFRRVGNSPWIPYRITLSKHYAVLLPDEEIREVILHEIAHAKVGPEVGHGYAWRVQARALGIAGNRCATPSVTPPKAVSARCLECDAPAGEQHRLPLRVYIHRPCRKPLTWFKNGRRLALDEMPTRYQDEWSIHYAR